MSWITLTEAKVATKISGPELNAVKTAALATSQPDVVADVVVQVTKEVRGYVAACGKNRLGEGDTIPDELEAAALSRCVFELGLRLPVPSLLNDNRKQANTNALSLFRDVAACHFAIEQPSTVSDQVISGPAISIVNSTTRNATRDRLSGL